LADLEVAWEIGDAWRDQDFSIVDRTSFAVMRRLGIDAVASLDEHFRIKLCLSLAAANGGVHLDGGNVPHSSFA
jgi:hypothetical protein